MEVVRWKTDTGKEVTVTVSLITEKVIWADGDKVTVPCCEIKVAATIDGVPAGSGTPEKANHPIAVAKIGKLGIRAEQLALIKEAIAKVEACPEWQAKIAKISQCEKEGCEYDAYRARMARVMGE